MEQTENPARERIVARIRTALRTPALLHPGPPTKRFFAPVANVLDCFQKECAAVGTECLVTLDRDASAVAIRDVLASLPPGEIFVQDSPELRSVAHEWASDRHVRWSSEGAAREASQATITMAEALVASTGSVLVSAACGGRAASIVAPVHIVPAKVEQLVPDLEAALAQAAKRALPEKNSFLSLITSSSRTADIQKILVLGAHGPRRLVVVLQTGP